MPIYYNGAHSIVFFKVNEDTEEVKQAMRSWTDLHMVPSNRPYVALPEPNIKMVSLPLSNNIIDATDFLAYDAIVRPREGSWDFYIDHDKYESHGEAYNTIIEFFDGSVFYVLLEDENEYVYYGRLYAGSYQSDTNYSKVNVQYSLDPDEQENNLLATKYITRNGTYRASDDGVLGYNVVIAKHDTGDIEADEYITGSTVSYYSPNVPAIRVSAFRNNKRLTHVECQNCSVIGSYAFFGCDKLKSVSFQNCSVINDYAFSGCSSLNRISFPECSKINAHAFDSCRTLSRVSFPKCSVIDSYAFDRCTGLSEVYFPNCTNIEIRAFEYAINLRSIYLPNCESIANLAFVSCSRLSEISLPVCTYIDYRAFANCINLKSIYLPLCSIAHYQTFENCTSLERVDGLQSCRTVNTMAFRSCTSLNYIELPEATIIYSGAFYGCHRLSVLSLPASRVCTLANSDAFDFTPIGGFRSYNNGKYGSIYVPSSLVSSYKSASNWSFYRSRITSIKT